MFCCLCKLGLSRLAFVTRAVASPLLSPLASSRPSPPVQEPTALIEQALSDLDEAVFIGKGDRALVKGMLLDLEWNIKMGLARAEDAMLYGSALTIDMTRRKSLSERLSSAIRQGGRRWSLGKHAEEGEERPPMESSLASKQLRAASEGMSAAVDYAKEEEEEAPAAEVEMTVMAEEVEMEQDSLIDELSHRLTNAMKSINTSSVASKSSLAAVKEKADEEEGAPVADRPELSA